MANVVKFNMKQVPAALSEMYVRITDTDRNELYSGTQSVDGSDIELNLGSLGSIGQSVLVHGDNFDGSNASTYKSFSGYSLIEEGFAGVRNFIQTDGVDDVYIMNTPMAVTGAFSFKFKFASNRDTLSIIAGSSDSNSSFFGIANGGFFLARIAGTTITAGLVNSGAIQTAEVQRDNNGNVKIYVDGVLSKTGFATGVVNLNVFLKYQYGSNFEGIPFSVDMSDLASGLVQKYEFTNNGTLTSLVGSDTITSSGISSSQIEEYEFDGVDTWSNISTSKLLPSPVMQAFEQGDLPVVDKYLTTELFPEYDSRYDNKGPEITVTKSPSSDSTIIGGVEVLGDDYTSFELLGSRLEYASHGGTPTSIYQPYIAPSTSSPQVVQGFVYDGQSIELGYRGDKGSFHVIVDGEVVASADVSTDAVSSVRWFKIDFGSAASRVVYVISESAERYRFTIEPSSNITPTVTTSPSVGVIGDSITDGTGSNIGFNFVDAVRWKLGAWDTTNFGVGGSGYLNDTASGKFINRLDELSGVSKPYDYLMVAGGINDSDLNMTDLSIAIDEFYDQALLTWDADHIIIIGSWGLGDTIEDGKFMQVSRLLQAKALEIGCYFVDPIRDHVIGGWATDANEYHYPDGPHPDNYMSNNYGHNIVATLFNKPIVIGI